tara:strand:- start:608 stop:1138 length:531 start_codon:yes stop_codon:yes gene_type:complete
MAIKDTTRKPFIEDNDTNVKIGIDLPIRRGNGSDGFFAATSTTIEAVKNNIRNLLNTERGERFFQPNLGIGLRKFLFQNITDESTLAIQNEILDVLDFWLPFVEVRNIQINSTLSNDAIDVNTLNIDIIFNIKQDPNTLQSVQLVVGGDTTSVDNVVSDNTNLGGTGGSVGGGGGY